VFALIATVIMLLAQGWIWKRLMRFLPRQRLGYQQLYRVLILGGSTSDNTYGFSRYAAGAVMGIAFVVAYSAIASKLLAAGWNLSLLAGWVDYAHPMDVRLAKNVAATAVGLLAFFALPYWLNQRFSRTR